VQAGFVEAGGTSLFVRRWGEADSPAVFYWHGGGGGSNEWPYFAPALEAAGYSVYAPDAPGYGESPPIEPDRYKTPAVADLALALVDELAIAPVIWVGYSWGGNGESTPSSGLPTGSRDSRSSTAVICSPRMTPPTTPRSTSSAESRTGAASSSSRRTWMRRRST
jgi:alpha-beta hydrolase superfamily lysophospholipase